MLESRHLLSAGFSPQATTAAGDAVARPADVPGSGFFVTNGKVYDANGYEFQIRGFNHTTRHGNATRNLDAINEFDKAGANAVRTTFGTFGVGTTPAQRKSIVEQYLSQGIVPIVEDHSATNGIYASQLQTIVDRWLQPENVQWLKQYESNIILNIANEWGPNTSLWRDAYISNIARIRAAGINAMIMVDAGQSGQSIYTIQQWARDILDADPNHNVVFSIHMYGYWRTEGATDVGSWSSPIGSPWDIATEIAEVQAAGIPLVVGEYSTQLNIHVPYDHRRAMEIYTAAGVGSLAWSWNQNSDATFDMIARTAGWNYDSDSDLRAFGKLVINDPALGLKHLARPSTVLHPATISGRLVDESDLPIAGATVFIDDNNNGQLDPAERSNVTTGTGTFALNKLPQGTHALRVVGNETRLTTVALPAGETVDVQLTTLAVAPTEATGTVSGYVFDDTSRDGYRQAGESGLEGHIVYLDLNRDGIADAGEPQTVTDSTGGYTFTEVPVGTHALRVVLPGGFVETTLAVDVASVAGGQFIAAPIGITQPPPQGAIAGTLLQDLNLNGIKDAGEVGYSSRDVFLDLNNNGTLDTNEPRTSTAFDGTFYFPRLDPGTYTVVRSPNNKFVVVLSTQVEVVAGETVESVLLTGLEMPATASGIVYTDSNSNGTHNTDEAVRAGVTVYIDTDGDGVLDAGEPSAVTDAAGAFVFTGLHPDNYTFRAVPPTGLIQTSAAASMYLSPNQYYTAIQLGVGLQLPPTPPPTPVTGSISGVYFHDVNGNRRLGSGESPIPGVVVYLDANNNGSLDTGEASTVTNAAGAFSFTSVVPGTQRLRSVVPAGTSLTTPVYDVILAPGQTFAVARFGLNAIPVTFNPASIRGVVFGDSNLNGIYDTGDPIGDNRVVFLDSNNNGKLDSGEPQTTTASNGTFSFTGLDAGTYYVRRVMPTGYTHSTQPIDLVLTAGQNVTNANIGSKKGTVPTPPPPPPPPVGELASIRGVVFGDANLNGVYDTGDSIGDNRVVFLDTNNNGKLDSGELQTTTASNGTFAFTGLVAGTYYVRRVMPTGYTYSTAPINLVLTAGQNVTNANIGSKKGTTTTPPPTTTGSISGFLYSDSNRNGLFNTGEPYIGARVVYLDTDNDNKLDSNEKNVTTDASGKFSFTGLAPGTYRVKRVLPTGYKMTSTPVVITLAAGQIIAGVAIGSASV